MRLGVFDDSSRPQRVPCRWLSFYLLGAQVSETLARRHIRRSGTLVFTYDDWSMVVTHEKGPEA